MENKPFIAVVCGEIETEKMKLIDDIRENPNMAFITIINPETNCHPKKQSFTAENIARSISVKCWNTVLTTNSFHYLEAFLFYLQKYGADNNLHFYLVENGNVRTSDNPCDIMKNLSQPTFDLADEKTCFELENEQEGFELD